jgi:sucrose-6-phosphate hydrolase SacC (GH32 family)
MHRFSFRRAAPIALALALAAAVHGGEPQEMKPIRDKTLVVWAAPASLDQRGGSALTLEDGSDHFDAIVFGELTPRKWMAGSNFFSRTQKKQDDYPAETADPETFVQMAIAYHEKQVTLYRNGERYAAYTIGAPHVFGEESFAVMGLRHVASGDGHCFTGAIEDARIYDVALTQEQIAALEPNQPSEPEPLAWWSFEDGQVSDRMGTFPNTKLFGEVKVADGKLHLGAGRSYLVSARGEPKEWQGTPGTESSLIASARAMREKLLADPHRPAYHFVVPEGLCGPFDPNGAIYWKGRYHLFYIFQDERGHNWGHASSLDLFHWRHHPTGLVSGMFSGNCFVNKNGVPTMCYHQVGQGNAMAVALDDELNQWKKLETNPITPKTEPGDPHHGKYRSWDPYGWVEDGTYYAIFGGKRPAVAKAPNLGGPWTYCGDLMANTVEGVSINEDVSCADFFQLGGRRMLLCISHRLGCRYYLGEWKNEAFHPTFHEKMSWVDNAYFAPESLVDDQGRRIMWAWIFDGRSKQTRVASGWSGTMGLPRVLWLGEDGMLRMRPPEEIERLRYRPKRAENLAIQADSELPLEDMGGTTIELMVEMVPGGAKQMGVKVCCSPDGKEQTLVYYDAAEKRLKVDTRRSSLGEGPKKVEAGPFELPEGQPLKLRVFVDKSVVEVFANDRQAVARRIYPTREDSTGVTLFANGGACQVPAVRAWTLMPSNPY